MRHAFVLLALMAATMTFTERAMAIEQPKYSVVAKDGDFELRHYDPYIVAEVVVSGDQGQAVQQGFRTLAGYIFGGNVGKAKIAMTAPVSQKPVGEKIAMANPVTQTPDGQGRWTVQFMMPSAYTEQTLPKPNDPHIRFRTEFAREMAVLQFSGVARERDYLQRTEALKRWIAARGLTTRGDATLAQYDPPWTPWFMRRNEVLLAITR